MNPFSIIYALSTLHLSIFKEWLRLLMEEEEEEKEEKVAFDICVIKGCV